MRGCVCQHLICEGYVCGSDPVTDANVVFICVADEWCRFSIDCGVVFWRQQQDAPAPWSVPEEQWTYPHRNVGREFRLEGNVLVGVEIGRNQGQTHIALQFVDGRTFRLIESHDRSRFAVSSATSEGQPQQSVGSDG